jgi:hypothetical protein
VNRSLNGLGVTTEGDIVGYYAGDDNTAESPHSCFDGSFLHVDPRTQRTQMTTAPVKSIDPAAISIVDIGLPE